MNIKLLLMVLTVGLCTSEILGQLPVVQAKGGDGKSIDWVAMKKAAENEDGPGFFDNQCAQGVVPAHCSSDLKSKGHYTYTIKNLSDDNPMTAWVEGKLGYGIGEWFEVKAITVNTIYNGYQSSIKNWKENSRVKRFKVYYNGEPLCFLDLTDEMGAQHFELPHRVNWEHKSNFKFEIVEVYKGEKWDDVCISHVDHVACCFAPNTMIALENTAQAIEQLEEGTTVLGIDLDKEKTFMSKVELTTQQRHLSLLNVATKNYQISVTPSHPLYIKGKGFIALEQILSQYPDKDWSDLTKMGLQVLVFDKAKEKMVYEPLTKVEKVEGDFQTYTILSLEKGSTYIANGFVNKVY